ncbi:MAG TPA: hypothetical protein VIA62_23360 [Thermoanaerobaculia bacterium]|nr:hypothetical protein [Thermoanaerobaculia bacterium]
MTKKLQLNSETLRQLSHPDLLNAAGGRITQPRPSGCPAQHSLCFDPITGCI